MKTVLASITLAAALVGSAAAQSTSAWGVEGPIRFANMDGFGVTVMDTKAGLPIYLSVYGLTATRDGKLNGFADVYVLEQNFGEGEEDIYRFGRFEVPISGVYKVSTKDTVKYFNRPGGDSSTRIAVGQSDLTYAFALRARGADYDVTVGASTKTVRTFGNAGMFEPMALMSGNDSNTVKVAARAGNYRGAGLDTIGDGVFDETQDATLRTTTASFPSELGSARSLTADAAVWDEGVDSEDEGAEPPIPSPLGDGTGGVTIISGKLYTVGQRAPGFLTIGQLSNGNYGIRTSVRVYTTATQTYVETLLSEGLFSYVNMVGDDGDPELSEELITQSSWNARGAFLQTMTATWDSGTLDETTGFVAP